MTLKRIQVKPAVLYYSGVVIDPLFLPFSLPLKNLQIYLSIYLFISTSQNQTRTQNQNQMLSYLTSHQITYHASQIEIKT